MSDRPYQKECTYCRKKIIMSKESGNWLPYDLDNGSHDCRDKKEIKQETSTQSFTKQEARLQHIIKQTQEILKQLEQFKAQEVEALKN